MLSLRKRQCEKCQIPFISPIQVVAVPQTAAPAGADANRLAGRTIFPLSNETEVEKRQEQNGIDDGTESGEFGRLDEAGAKDRHRNAIQPQIKENA
jgi:hypothetical protein